MNRVKNTTITRETTRFKHEEWSSYKERRANALALGAEEGRSKLR